jgi:hypothetical protein
MRDIKRLLEKHDVEAAAFDMDGIRCDLYIATEDRQHHLDIISDWDKIEKEVSDICYAFRNLFSHSREAQISEIEKMVRQKGATRIITSPEQKAAQIYEEHGVEEAYFYDHGDRQNHLLLGDIEGRNRIWREIDEIDREKVYFLWREETTTDNFDISKFKDLAHRLL